MILLETTPTILASLYHGEKFLYNNLRYTVYQQQSSMTEVFGAGRWWAWPSSAIVQLILPK